MDARRAATECVTEECKNECSPNAAELFRDGRGLVEGDGLMGSRRIDEALATTPLLPTGTTGSAEGFSDANDVRALWLLPTRHRASPRSVGSDLLRRSLGRGLAAARPTRLHPTTSPASRRWKPYARRYRGARRLYARRHAPNLCGKGARPGWRLAPEFIAPGPPAA